MRRGPIDIKTNLINIAYFFTVAIIVRFGWELGGWIVRRLF
jgi:hypothetical protein